MLEVLLNIWHFLQNAGSWLAYSLTHISEFIAKIPSALSSLTSAVNNYLPPFLVPFCLAFLSLSVFFKIINR